MEGKKCPRCNTLNNDFDFYCYACKLDISKISTDTYIPATKNQNIIANSASILGMVIMLFSTAVAVSVLGMILTVVGLALCFKFKAKRRLAIFAIICAVFAVIGISIKNDEMNAAAALKNNAAAVTAPTAPPAEKMLFGVCDICKQKGTIDCLKCGGDGMIWETRDVAVMLDGEAKLLKRRVEMPCRVCMNTGMLTCSGCNGTGFRNYEQNK